MHDDLQKFWGGGIPTPNPEPCCDELLDIIHDNEQGVEANAARLERLRTDVDSIEVRSNDNHVRLGATRTELNELEERVTNLQDNKLVQLERGIGNNATGISDLQAQLETCREEIGYLEDSLESYIKEIKERLGVVEKDIGTLKTKITIIGWLRKLFGQSDE
jgi:chromosome segregation ATPase